MHHRIMRVSASFPGAYALSHEGPYGNGPNIGNGQNEGYGPSYGVHWTPDG